MEAKISRCIMFIDDNEDDIFLHQQIIETLKISARIQSFNDATDALNYLKLIDKQPAYYDLFAPWIILLDINMPDMDGFEFFEEYNKLGIFTRRPIPVFFLSSYGDPLNIQKAKNKKGCSGFLVKPLNGEVLLSYIHEK